MRSISTGLQTQGECAGAKWERLNEGPEWSGWKRGVLVLSLLQHSEAACPCTGHGPPAGASMNRGYLGESMEQNLDDSQPFRSNKPGFKFLPCLNDLCDLGQTELAESVSSSIKWAQ